MLRLIRPNATCDIYRNGGTLSAAAVPCSIHSVFKAGLKKLESTSTNKKYSHILSVDYQVDIRDGWSYGTITNGNRDKVYIPTGSTNLFYVVFVQKEGTIKRAYLQRQTVDWSVGADIV